MTIRSISAPGYRGRVRHFADFDAFLAELIEDRIARIGDQAAVLRESAGTGTVAGNLTGVVRDDIGSS